MKKHLFLVTLLFTFIISHVVLAEPYMEMHENGVTLDSIKFRGFDWGTSVEDIQTAEITSDMLEIIDYSLDEENRTFTIKTTVATLDLFAVFRFDENWKLIEGDYSLDGTGKNENEYYDAFCLLDSLLEKQYGEPSLALNIGFSDDLANLQTEEIKHALLNNSAGIFDLWAAKDASCITIFCYTDDNGEITFSFSYLDDFYKILDVINALTDTNGL